MYFSKLSFKYFLKIKIKVLHLTFIVNRLTLLLEGIELEKLSIMTLKYIIKFFYHKQSKNVVI